MPSLAESVVVYFHTKTPLVQQKRENKPNHFASACRSAVKPKQYSKSSYRKKPGPRHDGIRQLQENQSSDTESSADDEYFYTKPAKRNPSC